MKDLSFEEAYLRLEKIIENLQDENRSLEDSIEDFKEGIELNKICQSKLKTAKQVVEKLVDENKTEGIDYEE